MLPETTRMPSEVTAPKRIGELKETALIKQPPEGARSPSTFSASAVPGSSSPQRGDPGERLSV